MLLVLQVTDEEAWDVQVGVLMIEGELQLDQS